MRLTVQLFGPLARAAGSGEVEVEVGDASITCGALRQALAQAHPSLGEPLPAYRFAVNHAFVSDDHQVTDSDEIALIGMVSGG